MIELKDISKKFDGKTALRNVSLKIETGKTYALIGPSGCGKSTIIRILTGLISADSGEVLINNTSVIQSNISNIRKKIGYVIQDGGLFPHLSAEENIILVPKYFNWNENKIKSRLSELVELNNFPEDALNRYPVQLSGGQKQRVSLMRALMMDPETLLLDEPLGALDPLIRFDLQSELKEIFSKLDKTVLLVTHDLAEAIYFGHQIILMRDGNIVQKGRPTDIVEKPINDFVKKFTSAQRINFKTEN